jgi:hypothetical protein
MDSIELESLHVPLKEKYRSGICGGNAERNEIHSFPVADIVPGIKLH